MSAIFGLLMLLAPIFAPAAPDVITQVFWHDQVWEAAWGYPAGTDPALKHVYAKHESWPGYVRLSTNTTVAEDSPAARVFENRLYIAWTVQNCATCKGRTYWASTNADANTRESGPVADAWWSVYDLRQPWLIVRGTNPAVLYVSALWWYAGPQEPLPGTTRIEWHWWANNWGYDSQYTETPLYLPMLRATSGIATVP